MRATIFRSGKKTELIAIQFDCFIEGDDSDRAQGSSDVLLH